MRNLKGSDKNSINSTFFQLRLQSFTFKFWQMQRTNVQLYHDFTYFVGQEFCLTPSRTSKVLYPSCISKTYTRQKSRLNQKLPFFFCVFILDVWMVEVKYKYIVSTVWFLEGRQIFEFRKRTRSLGFPDLCLFWIDWLLGFLKVQRLLYISSTQH